MKTVLIIGVAGFVGSHLAESCLSKGWKVVGIDDFSSGKQENLKGIKDKSFVFIKQDLSKYGSSSLLVKKLISMGSKQVDVVVQLAARKIPRYGHRLETLIVNIETTKSAGELAKYFKARLIFASTSDVYGMSTDLPFQENGNLTFGPSYVARWAYGSSKYVGEQLAYGFSEECGIPIVIVRIFGVYGPRQVEGWKGNAVSAFFQQARKEEEYELHGDGRQTRTFLYIDDLINGLTAAIKNNDINGEVINFGSQEKISMNDLAHKIHRLVRPKEKFSTTFVDHKSFTGNEYQDMTIKIPDIAKADKKLNWRPSFRLDDGLKLTANWYLSRIK